MFNKPKASTQYFFSKKKSLMNQEYLKTIWGKKSNLIISLQELKSIQNEHDSLGYVPISRKLPHIDESIDQLLERKFLAEGKKQKSQKIEYLLIQHIEKELYNKINDQIFIDLVEFLRDIEIDFRYYLYKHEDIEFQTLPFDQVIKAK